MENIAWGPEGGVVIVDQTRLPGALVYLNLTTAEEMYEAIHSLRVRGAPAIGIFAAYALAALLDAEFGSPAEQADTAPFFKRLRKLSAYLGSSRPTAVNLSWALSRMERVALAHAGEGARALTARLRQEAENIRREDIEMCLAISAHGLSLLHDGDGVLTHCNAGPLATSHYGTGLGPLLLGRERGYHFHAYVDETRPLLQGARLTAWELQQAGVEVTLICDNMASMVMKNGWVQACLVGCDRVAANGDVANKIGTSGVAILARHYGIPFYVLGPTSTIDWDCKTGDDICIELRKPGEIREMFYQKPMAPEGIDCYNPAFDVTGHELISAIITENGICRPPYSESLRRQALRGEGVL